LRFWAKTEPARASRKNRRIVYAAYQKASWLREE
jgi:hypothetical protein